MAANTATIYPLTPNFGGVQFGSAALTKSDGSSGVVGIGTDIFKILTAGAFGSYIKKVRFIPVATTAATATSPTVHRLYFSSVTTGVTANTNTFLIQEFSAAAQTADATTAGVFFFDVPIELVLNANWTLLVSTHIINANNTNWTALGFAFDF